MVIISIYMFSKMGVTDYPTFAILPPEQYKFGTVVQEAFWNGNKPAAESATYIARFKELYSYGVTAQSGRMQNINPSRNVFNWADLDLLLNWSEANNIKIKYHRFASEAVPDWYSYLNEADSLTYLEAYVRNVTRRYKGRIFMYDVANHPIYFGDEYSYMGTGLGRVDAITRIFNWAREEDSDAILIINEQYITTVPSIRQKYIQLIQELLAAGAPIDGIGIMEHFGIDAKIPSDATINNALNELDVLGLPIYVTEFDLDISRINPNAVFVADGITYDTWWDYQAYAYPHYYQLVMSHPSVASIASWGFYDGYIWRAGAGLFDTSFNPKPVYYTLQPILSQTMQYIQFRTSNLSYPNDGAISFSASCDGSLLTQYGYVTCAYCSGIGTSGTSCMSSTSGYTKIIDLPGTLSKWSSGLGNTLSLFSKNDDATIRVVCGFKDGRYAYQTYDSDDLDKTKVSDSAQNINPSYEVGCQTECIPGDGLDGSTCDNIVSSAELGVAITKWMNGDFDMARDQLGTAIQSWVNG